MNPKAVVLLSGGQDSTTTLFWAIKKGFENVALTINYGQRHVTEIESALRVARLAGCADHIIYTLPTLPIESALVNEGDINAPHPMNPNLPASFVPGRNLLFLAIAAAIAYSRGIEDIFIGVNQTDYSGYPDCRQTTIDAQAIALSQGLDKRMNIHTPLINMPKAAICIKGYALGEKCVEALSYTTTCYNGKFPPCMKCPACLIRAKGFIKANLEDPILTRIKNLGK